MMHYCFQSPFSASHTDHDSCEQNTIDPAMLRPGRLERKIYVGLPGDEERVEILQTHMRSRSLEYHEEFAQIARDCKGFSGADLASLLTRAGEAAVERDDDIIRIQDFEFAKAEVPPSVIDMTHYEALKIKWGKRR